MPKSDEVLAAEFAAGSLQAYSELVRRRYKSVLYFCRSFLGNDADAEDAAQDTFHRVSASIGQFRGDSKFSSWLMQIAANRCRDMLKKKRPLEMTEDFDAPDRSSQGVGLENMLQSEHQSLVEECLQRMPSDLRAVLQLKYEQQLKGEQIMQLLDISRDTLWKRLQRAKDFIRNYVSQKTH